MRYFTPLAMAAFASLAGCAPLPMAGPTSSGAGGTSAGTGGASVGSGGAPSEFVDTKLACGSTFADLTAPGDPATLLWGVAVPGRSQEHGSFHADTDPAGNTVVADEFNPVADFGGGVTLADPSVQPGAGHYLARYSASGELQWAHETAAFHASALAAAASGSFWTSGGALSSGGLVTSLRRWDVAGALVWEHATAPEPQRLLPVEGDRIITAFSFGASGVNYGTGKLSPPPGISYDAALVAFGSEGDVAWTLSFASHLWPDAPSDGGAAVSVRDLQRAPGGGALVLLRLDLPPVATPAAERGFALVRVSPDGAVRWIRRFPKVPLAAFPQLASGPQGESLLEFGLNPDQSIDLGCGALTGPMVLAKFAPDGASEWIRTFAGQNCLPAVSFDPQGDIVMAGAAFSPCDLGAGDLVPQDAGADEGRLAFARFGADGSHRSSGVVGGPVSAAVVSHLRVDAQGHLNIDGEVFGADNWFGVQPAPMDAIYLARIAY